MAVDVDLFGDSGDDLLGQRFRRGRLFAVGRDDGELVAAEPRHEGAADRLLQAARDFAKQVVADDVAEHVVDLLEAVDVERHQREGRAVLGRALDGRAEALVEGGAVRQAGERVVMHHVRDLRFRALAVGAVLDHGQQVLDFALLVADRHARGGDDAGSGARRRGRMLVVELRLAGPQQVVVVLGDQLRGLRREDLFRSLADHALALGAEIGLAGAVDQDVAQRLGVLHDDGRGHVLDHRGGEQVAAVALLLGAAALGDVLVGHDPAAAVGRRLAEDRDDALSGSSSSVWVGSRFCIASLSSAM